MSRSGAGNASARRRPCLPGLVMAPPPVLKTVADGQPRDYVAFQRTEPLLAVIFEDIGDRAAAFLFDEGIGIHKRHIQPLGNDSADARSFRSRGSRKARSASFQHSPDCIPETRGTICSRTAPVIETPPSQGQGRQNSSRSGGRLPGRWCRHGARPAG